MYQGTWDDRILAIDGSVMLWQAVESVLLELRTVDCALMLHWVPDHTTGDSRDVTAVLYEATAGRCLCTGTLSSSLEAQLWKVLRAVRGSKTKETPVWE